MRSQALAVSLKIMTRSEDIVKKKKANKKYHTKASHAIDDGDREKE